MALRTDQKMVILQLATGGLSIRAIASATGHSPTTVQRYLADWFTNDDGTLLVTTKQGLDGKRRPSRRYDTTERDERIRLLHGRLTPMADIAAEVGCSVGTVHRVLKGQR